MQLSSYLSENKITMADFAALIGRSEATVSRIARGLHRPDWTTMQAIRSATNDKVRPDDFIEPPAAKPDQPTPQPEAKGVAAA